MTVETIVTNNVQIAEIISGDRVIGSAQDGLDLLGTVYYQGFDKVIIYAKDITPDFFDLKTGIAGEILQKFSNYRVRLAIVGDFSGHQSTSIKAFISESNRFGQINFASSKEEAIAKLLKEA